MNINLSAGSGDVSLIGKPNEFNSLTVEIAVDTISGARVAATAGADRIELCAALGTGGLTPSFGFAAASVELCSETDLPGGVFALVRAREGGYVYNEDELRVQLNDVRAFLGLGVRGVVVGALRPDGKIDGTAMRRFVEAAEGAPVVFHRAIDAMPDTTEAIDQLVELGVARVLTSGGATRSIEGIDRIAEYVRQAAGQLQVMAGGGVHIDDIGALRAVGIEAVHLSARAQSVDQAPAGPGGGMATVSRTDEALIRAAIAAARV